MLSDSCLMPQAKKKKKKPLSKPSCARAICTPGLSPPRLRMPQPVPRKGNAFWHPMYPTAQHTFLALLKCRIMPLNFAITCHGNPSHFPNPPWLPKSHYYRYSMMSKTVRKGVTRSPAIMWGLHVRMWWYRQAGLTWKCCEFKLLKVKKFSAFPYVTSEWNSFRVTTKPLGSPWGTMLAQIPTPAPACCFPLVMIIFQLPAPISSFLPFKLMSSFPTAFLIPDTIPTLLSAHDVCDVQSTCNSWQLLPSLCCLQTVRRKHEKKSKQKNLKQPCPQFSGLAQP